MIAVVKFRREFRKLYPATTQMTMAASALVALMMPPSITVVGQ